MPDTAKPFILETDASKWAIGATLLQKQDDGQLHPCGYLSKKLFPNPLVARFGGGAVCCVGCPEILNATQVSYGPGFWKLTKTCVCHLLQTR
jgi:hypothetical protein